MRSFSRALAALLFLFCASSAGAAQQTYKFTNPSVVGFKANAFLHDFSGETSNIEGKFELDLNDLERPGRGAIEIEARALNTKNRKRDRDMREKHLHVKRHPFIRFVVIRAKLDSRDVIEKKADYVLDGELQLHGVRQNIRVLATLDYRDPDNLEITGEVPLLMSDFDIPTPRLGLIKVKDRVKVYFKLTATKG